MIGTTAGQPFTPNGAGEGRGFSREADGMLVKPLASPGRMGRTK